MKDHWMNVGHEEEELKPYIEPEADFNDSTRIGAFRRTSRSSSKGLLTRVTSNFVFPTELMVTMGFPKDEITESLQNQKYDDVMATYLLLGRKAPEVRFLLMSTSCPGVKCN